MLSEHPEYKMQNYMILLFETLFSVSDSASNLSQSRTYSGNNC